MMDEQTRFWIAQEVADTKYTADVRPLFRLAKAVAGKAPKTLVSDGAPNFHEAYNREFRALKLENRTEQFTVETAWMSCVSFLQIALT
jgi:hypothetical protein